MDGEGGASDKDADVDVDADAAAETLNDNSSWPAIKEPATLSEAGSSSSFVATIPIVTSTSARTSSSASSYRFCL